MSVRIPRLVIAGLSGDSGKTIVCLSLLAALRRKGVALSVFKKGPDYIDSAWLSKVAQAVCRNLDTYMVDPSVVFRTFTANAAKAEFALIEGNRGLFDGKDVSGTHSTAELAKLLQAPVVLVVNTAKATRTVAALVNGCLSFDPQVKIAGVILNRVAGSRHGRIITDAIERYCHLPVLGKLPRLGDDSTLIAGRHLGLIPPTEVDANADFDERLAAIAEEHLDVDRLIEVASKAPPLDVPQREKATTDRAIVKIGYFKDSVFTFYYPENLEALKTSGAELIPFDSLGEKKLPDIDALYIGGGFPETHAAQLADNRSILESVKQRAEEGLPIYAECGGLIFLSRTLTIKDSIYPMAGLFPVDLQLHSRPVGHGYTLLQVNRMNPFFEIGTIIKGHEFHYTDVVGLPESIETCMEVKSGVGIGEKRDGLVYKQVVAAYTHIHAAGVPGWAVALVARAREYRANRRNNQDNANDSAAGLESSGDSHDSLHGKAGETIVAIEQRPASTISG